MTNEKPAIPLKEENEAKPQPVAQPKIIYQPGQAGDKKPMIILQPKKPLQIPTVRAGQSVFKVMQQGMTVVSSASNPIKVRKFCLILK